MATKHSKTHSTRTPRLDVFRIERKFPVTLLAFHKRDAVEQLQQFAEALQALVEASAGERFIVESGELTLLSREPLPQDR